VLGASPTTTIKLKALFNARREGEKQRPPDTSSEDSTRGSALRLGGLATASDVRHVLLALPAAPQLYDSLLLRLPRENHTYAMFCWPCQQIPSFTIRRCCACHAEKANHKAGHAYYQKYLFVFFKPTSQLYDLRFVPARPANSIIKLAMCWQGHEKHTAMMFCTSRASKFNHKAGDVLAGPRKTHCYDVSYQPGQQIQS
jgi:hypothetical protein